MITSGTDMSIFIALPLAGMALEAIKSLLIPNNPCLP